MKDCTTCKYGYEDERLGIPMCHHPKRFSEDCVDFNMHEEINKSEKPTQEGLEEEVEKICIEIANELPNVDFKDKNAMFELALKEYCKRYYNYNYPEQGENSSPIMPHIIEAARYFFIFGNLISTYEKE